MTKAENPADYAAQRARAIYDYGETPIFASKIDPRFHMLLFVPHTAMEEGRKLELIVAVHGSGRTSAMEFRDNLAEFALWHDCAVLCPIFPIGPLGDGAKSGYKYMQEGDIRYDKVLLGMVDEIAEKYSQNWDKFAMFGYSGGGHFTHRFAILYPEKLWAASVGAPGSVTLLNPDRDWWVGIRDVAERFGRPFDAAALAKVPVHMIVGDADTETWEISHAPGSPHYVEGANDAGDTRPERLTSLAESFRKAGVNVTLELVPGISHDRLKVLGRVKKFFAATLERMRKA